MLNASKMLQSRLRGSDILRLPVSSLSSNSMFHRLPLLPQNVSTPALNPYPQLGWSSNRLGKSPVSHLLPLFGVTSFHIVGQVARHHQRKRKRKRVSRWHERWLRKCSAERLSVVETVSLYTLQRLPAEGQKGRFCCEPASTWTACGRWYRSFGPSHTFTMVQINIMAIWWNHCGGQQLIGSLVYYTMNIIYYICGHDIMCIYIHVLRTHNIYIHIQGKQPAARLELEHLGGRAKASDLSLSDVSLSCSDKVASLSRFFSASRQ